MSSSQGVEELPWDALERLMANVWTPDNPKGLVLLNVAENHLLHQEVVMHLRTHSGISANNHHLGYGVGPRGSLRLLDALASFLNSEFQPNQPALRKDILILPGVVAILDAITWSICDEHEGILTPAPYYTGYKPATSVRARAKLIPAPFHSLEGYRGLDDIFDPDMNTNALSNALHQATEDGVIVRAVLISNPHNPLGRCYPPATLQAIAKFCKFNDLHLISDEVFATSVYDNPQTQNPMPFTSILGATMENCIDQRRVHVAYGMGKDFGATGLRLGALYSKNEGVIAAVSSISVFGWVPYVVQDMWACILDDAQFLSNLKAKNRRALAKHSTLLRSFLEQHNIPYYNNGHAGVFLWADLSQYLPEESLVGPQRDSKRTPGYERSIVESKQDGETRLFKYLMNEGVSIAPGTQFASEEVGWFRISFAVPEEELAAGIQKLTNCFQSLKAKGKKTHWESLH